MNTTTQEDIRSAKGSDAKKTKPMGLFESAEAAWPEDEASLTFDTFTGRMDEAQDEADRKYDSGLFLKDIAHMHRVFGFESDAVELVARYDAALVSRMKERHAYAFKKLAEYSADDEISAERLAGLLGAKTIAALAASRDSLITLLACDSSIEELHAELTRLSTP